MSLRTRHRLPSLLLPLAATAGFAGTGGGVTPKALQANRNPYDKRNLSPTQDRRYSIQSRFTSASPKTIAANGAGSSSNRGDRP